MISFLAENIHHGQIIALSRISLAWNLRNVKIGVYSIYPRSRDLLRSKQLCVFTPRVCAQSKRRLFHTVRYAVEYEKLPADRGDVAKANKVPAKQHDRTDEARHLTMYYSNCFITGIRRCVDESLLLPPLSRV